MEITVNGVNKALLTKERKIGSEAPAISVTMLNGDIKVIGMMATKVQVMVSLPFPDALSFKMQEILTKYHDKAFIYLIAPVPFEGVLDTSMASLEFNEFSKKFGVYIDETLCAKSVFIIDKEGCVVYKEIPEAIENEFDVPAFEAKLDETIHFKRKGHVHENWMGT